MATVSQETQTLRIARTLAAPLLVSTGTGRVVQCRPCPPHSKAGSSWRSARARCSTSRKRTACSRRTTTTPTCSCSWRGWTRRRSQAWRSRWRASCWPSTPARRRARQVTPADQPAARFARAGCSSGRHRVKVLPWSGALVTSMERAATTAAPRRGLSGNTTQPTEALPKARDAAERAVAADPVEGERPVEPLERGAGPADAPGSLIRLSRLPGAQAAPRA